MRKPRRLNIEPLERRQVLATFSVPWPEIGDLTLSFVPDGTQLGEKTSDLFTLDAARGDSNWQLDVLRAFQTWAVESDINIGLVEDGGQPLDTLGFKQGDVRFGDVRIGAFPMADDVLAVANPYDPFIANTWVGDVFLNSANQFDLFSPESIYDLFTVVLHEAGHVYGIGHSQDADSAMFPQFVDKVTQLTEEDVDTLIGLYGVRREDAWEQATGNQTLATATNVPLVDAQGDARTAVLDADVSSTGDIDVYSVTLPSDASGLGLRLGAAGKSLLLAKVSVFNANGDLLASAQAFDPRQNDLHIDTVAGQAGDVLYVQVEAATDDVFGVGGYRMEFIPQSGSDGAEPRPMALEDEEFEFALAAQDASLLATTPGYVEHTYYEVAGAVSIAEPSNFFRVRSVDLGPETDNVMMVIVRSLDESDPGFDVTVRDVQGQVIAANTIEQTGGVVAVQIPAVASAQDFLIEVRGQQLTARDSVYEIEVDFALDGTHLETYVNESLASGISESWRTLQVEQTQQFHFQLSASDWGHARETGVVMEIFDTAGLRRFQLAAPDGATRTGDVLLEPGAYQVRFARNAGGATLPVVFELNGLSSTSPLGPQLRDTTREPVASSAALPLDQLAFYWLPQGVAPVASQATVQLPAAPLQVARHVVSNDTTPLAAGEQRLENAAEQLAVTLVESRAPAHTSRFDFGGSMSRPPQSPSEPQAEQQPESTPEATGESERAPASQAEREAAFASQPMPEANNSVLLDQAAQSQPTPEPREATLSSFEIAMLPAQHAGRSSSRATLSKDDAAAVDGLESRANFFGQAVFEWIGERVPLPYIAWTAASLLCGWAIAVRRLARCQNCDKNRDSDCC
ncbi:MAG: matrixin family metalloprotease [Planctomycetales bacterium]|nr:matrixin family metalloprotease [Planctomycetales bacterium]